MKLEKCHQLESESEKRELLEFILGETEDDNIKQVRELFLKDHISLDLEEFHAVIISKQEILK